MSKLLTVKNVKQFVLIFGVMVVALALFHYTNVHAASSGLIDPADSPGNVQDATGSEGSARVLARTIINFFLYFLGFIATAMFIFGGAQYVTAGGDEGKVEKAKKMLTYAIIGIIVILLSFAVVNTVLEAGEGGEPVV